MPNNNTEPVHHFTFHDVTFTSDGAGTKMTFTAGCHQCNFSFTGSQGDSNIARTDHELRAAAEVTAYWREH